MMHHYNTIYFQTCQKTMVTSFKLYLCIFVFIATLVQVKEVYVKNLKIYDNKGRELYLRGTNVVVKVPPYIPSTTQYDPVWSFASQDIKILKQNGFNSIRLGLMWAGVEPKKDWYNQTYLDEMVKIVNAAGQAGIYTLIDFHQDLLSQKFCGDGVPIWLMDELKAYKTFPFPMGRKIKLNETGLPDWNDCDKDNWGKYYFSYDVGQGFNDLYNSNHKLNKKFHAFWEKLAQTFAGNPYVIAYELINEPFIGNFWRNPALVIPSMAQRLKFQQFYDKLSETIRKVDGDTPICFQPVTFDNFVPSGFSHPPGGNKFRNQSVLCYHHYQPPALSIKSFDTYVHDAKNLKIASLLSQTFGGDEVLDRAEYWKQGWMYWEYKSFGKGWGMPGQRKTQNIKSIIESPESDDDNRLMRTYLPYVAGELQESKFNTTSGYFSATYYAVPNGETVLFINKPKAYGTGYMITSYPESQTQITENGNYITIKYLGSEIKKKILVTVARL